MKIAQPAGTSAELEYLLAQLPPHLAFEMRAELLEQAEQGVLINPAALVANLLRRISVEAQRQQIKRDAAAAQAVDVDVALELAEYREHKALYENLNVQARARVDTVHGILTQNPGSGLSHEDKVTLVRNLVPVTGLPDAAAQNIATTVVTMGPHVDAMIADMRANPAATIAAQIEDEVRTHALQVIAESPAVPEPVRAAARQAVGLKLGVDPKAPDLPKAVVQAAQAFTAKAQSFFVPALKGLSAEQQALIQGLAVGDINADARAAIQRAIDIYGEPSQARRDAAIRVMAGHGGTPQAVQDAAIIQYSSILASRVAFETLHGRAMELAQGKSAGPDLFTGTPQERAGRLAVVMRENPDLKAMSADQIQKISMGAIAVMDTEYKGSSKNIAGASSEKLQASSQSVAMSVLKKVIEDGLKIENDYKTLSPEEQKVRQDKRTGLRDGGISTVELEFMDMIELSANFKKAAGGKTAEQLIAGFEKSGIFTDNKGANHGDWKFHVGGTWDAVQKWGDENLKRIDLDGNGQVGAREATLAKMLDDFIQNPKNKTLIDLNKDGKLDGHEVKAGMLYMEGKPLPTQMQAKAPARSN